MALGLAHDSSVDHKSGTTTRAAVVQVGLVRCPWFRCVRKVGRDPGRAFVLRAVGRVRPRFRPQCCDTSAPGDAVLMLTDGWNGTVPVTVNDK